MIEVFAAVAAWLGASLVVLSDGRRGLALGVALAGAGMAAGVYPAAGAAGTAVLAAGGLAAAAWRVRVGPAGWRVMPAGSTPRLVMCVAAALLTLWVALAVTGGPDTGLRYAVMVAAGLAAARVLGADEPAVLVTAAAVLALATGAGAALGGGQPGIWPFAAGAVVAAAAGLWPASVRRDG